MSSDQIPTECVKVSFRKQGAVVEGLIRSVPSMELPKTQHAHLPPLFSDGSV